MSVETVHSDNCGFYQATLPFTEISRRSAGTVQRGILGNSFPGFLCWCNSYIQVCVLEASSKGKAVLRIAWLFLLRIQHGQTTAPFLLSHGLLCAEKTWPLLVLVGAIFKVSNGLCLW